MKKGPYPVQAELFAVFRPVHDTTTQAFFVYLSQDYKRERNYANEYRTRDAHPRSWLVLKSVQGVSKSDQLFFPVLFRIPALYLLLFQSPFYFHRSTPVSFNFFFPFFVFFLFFFVVIIVVLLFFHFFSVLFDDTGGVPCNKQSTIVYFSTTRRVNVSIYLYIYIPTSIRVSTCISRGKTGARMRSGSFPWDQETGCVCTKPKTQTLSSTDLPTIIGNFPITHPEQTKLGILACPRF